MASPHSVNVNIRARPREVEQWRAAAVHADETLSAWIRVTLNRLSRRPVRRAIASSGRLRRPRAK